MSGDAEAGGGGSVYWKIDADNVETNDAHHSHVNKKVHQDGWDDKDGAVNVDHFTVSIKVPRGVTGNFLGLTPVGGRVSFNLPIENDKKQIRISWGPNNPNVKP